MSGAGVLLGAGGTAGSGPGTEDGAVSVTGGSALSLIDEPCPPLIDK
jgi:hypothetical protein